MSGKKVFAVGMIFTVYVFTAAKVLDQNQHIHELNEKIETLQHKDLMVERDEMTNKMKASVKEERDEK